MADVDLGQELGFGGRVSDLVGVFRPMVINLAPNGLFLGPHAMPRLRLRPNPFTAQNRY